MLGRLYAIGAALLVWSLATPARADPAAAPGGGADAGAVDGALPAGVTWRWNSALEDRPRFQVAGPERSRFVFSARPRPSQIRRLDARGGVVWRYAIPGLRPLDAVLLLEGDVLYAALYRGMTSGCRAIALDARTGTLLWDEPLRGLGPIAHSAYENRVQIDLQPAGLVIYGNEWRGRYIEVLRPADGRRIGHRLLGR